MDDFEDEKELKEVDVRTLYARPKFAKNKGSGYKYNYTKPSETISTDIPNISSEKKTNFRDLRKKPGIA